MERMITLCGKYICALLLCAMILTLPHELYFGVVSAEAAVRSAKKSKKVETDTKPQQPDKIFLDADEVSYDEDTGVATAEGKVKVENKNVKLFAPYAEYNSETNIVDAYSSVSEDVIIISSGDKYVGKHLKYNLEKGRGIFTEVSGKSGPMFMKGGRVRYMSKEDAQKEGILRAPKKNAKKGADEEKVAEWLGVTSTTCDFKNPHYRLVSKKVVIYPGKKTVLKTPKLYFGKTLILTYPFDYIAGQKRKESLIPIVRYNSDKGTGFGVKGPIDLGNWGELDIAALYWTNDIWEGRFDYSYEVFDSFTVFANVNHLYNKDTMDTKWRPMWGARYEKNGWLAQLLWAERQLVGNEITTDVTVDYDVWKKPEFSIYSPAIKEGLLGGSLRFFAIWGKYSDNITQYQWINRLAYGASYQSNPNWSMGIFKPYFGLAFAHYDYYDNDKTQDVTNAYLGLRYNFGAFNFTSTYRRRWGDVAGSPMGWDRYGDEESFVQSISFPLPFGASWEKWNLNVVGTYDMLLDKLSSMNYVLTYNKHCTTWQVWVRDKITENELYLGLTFFINAFPDQKISFGTLENRSVRDDF
ncbi:MAG: hypothetical protein HUJ86_01550 [Synergistes sp.]|nr:hypothetical protein [Synergistes sp.]